MKVKNRIFFHLIITFVASSLFIGCQKDEDNTGQTGTVNDIDGNVYLTIGIGNQIWMAGNLKTTKFNDGSNIPFITDQTVWAGLTTPAYCWYNNDQSSMGNIYGALYNRFAVSILNNGAKNVCPIGWHVPANPEWTVLINYLGGANFAGGKLKEKGTVLWQSPNTEATDENGFKALPGGFRTSDGEFNGIGFFGYWWSSSEDHANYGTGWTLSSSYGYINSSDNLNQAGFSVRCVKDSF
jgi:uncharacterized protein (TIGR02145 family)